ncbi:TetR/AcrR family transcriptional regulator [Galbitalea soli]|uniref:TetR/AcrR family transcriptional regulator n=1 Tax=Galbitalea soli TaxID=1268042 RepID=A0A7C9TR03_9MICO|nr:TetR/AcrR family transcriptional regulator [Galbitalea soli]NEM90984.1 TetR/AcrR family transcriptional regulator [Galbitalea soli]NYJ29671.1 AcrR family transcriptional regulator [Galbitalea soli]
MTETPPGARDRMIAGAVRLLATRGLQATSFSEVIAATGAPRGSIYHHFPDGKDQLVASAVALAGQRALDALESVRGSSAVEVAELFLRLWRALVVGSEFTAGCSVLAVTVATDDAPLLEATAGVFRAWRGRLAELLEAGGVSPDDAPRLAALLVAGSEGAVVMARAEQDVAPFDLVADQLRDEVRRAAV